MYPNTLPCPRIATSEIKFSGTFASNVFDYGTRKTRVPNSVYKAQWSVILDGTQMTDFKRFYQEINYGVDSFQATWAYEGTTTEHTYRYITPLTISNLGKGLYVVASDIEVIGQIAKTCTLQVSSGLLMTADLVICQSA